jgi:hypothetical protein
VIWKGDSTAAARVPNAVEMPHPLRAPAASKTATATLTLLPGSSLAPHFMPGIFMVSIPLRLLLSTWCSSGPAARLPACEAVHAIPTGF